MKSDTPCKDFSDPGILLTLQAQAVQAVASRLPLSLARLYITPPHSYSPIANSSASHPGPEAAGVHPVCRWPGSGWLCSHGFGAWASEWTVCVLTWRYPNAKPRARSIQGLCCCRQQHASDNCPKIACLSLVCCAVACCDFHAFAPNSLSLVTSGHVWAGVLMFSKSILRAWTFQDFEGTSA